MLNIQFDGILPKGPYPPCLCMADRALLVGYPRIPIHMLLVTSNNISIQNAVSCIEYTPRIMHMVQIWYWWFTHILHCYFTGTEAITYLSQDQWSDPEEFGLMDHLNPLRSNNMATTKQSTTKQSEHINRVHCTHYIKYHAIKCYIRQYYTCVTWGGVMQFHASLQWHFYQQLI